MEAKVCIGVPHVGEIRPYFFDTMLSLKKSARTTVVRVQNKPVDMARNMIVSAFLQTDATHLFFMDSDQMFPPEALDRLLARDLDVVGGTYFARTETPIPHAYRFEREDYDEKGSLRQWYRTLGAEFASWWKANSNGEFMPHPYVYPDSADALVPCDALATGCLLIKRRVLEAIAYPWFKCWPDSAGGEDFDFCRKAKEAGFDVWADFSVQCGHEAQMVFIGAQDFIETYAIGTEDEYNFVDPVLVEAGPNGRRVRPGVNPEDAKPDSEQPGLTMIRRPLKNSSEVA